MFISCHPVLSKEARIALTLRVVGGLGSDEIATAFLVPVATIQARITRAKKTLAAAQVPFAVPDRQELNERLGSVLQVVYLIFTEGSFASGGEEWIRTDLAGEAAGWPASWCGSRPSRRYSGFSRCWNSRQPGSRPDLMRPAARSFWRTRTGGCGTRRRSGAGVRRWHRLWGPDVDWAHMASKPPSPSVTRWLARLPKRTGSGS
ncbi:uncharacterized protein R00370 [Arthrobacter sp. Hiyo8]|nr:uncharacterized protein R00370 [Arthrobacter sp. Hiyo8]